MKIQADGAVKEASLSAVITRADGTVEDLGVISYHNRNVWRLLWWRLTHRKG